MWELFVIGCKAASTKKNSKKKQHKNNVLKNCVYQYTGNQILNISGQPGTIKLQLKFNTALVR